MIEYQNLALIGTSHISKDSKAEVVKTIMELEPQFVAIELDFQRLQALLGKKKKLRIKDIKRIGVRGFLFALIGSWVQGRLAKMVGAQPGQEKHVLADAKP